MKRTTPAGGRGDRLRGRSLSGTRAWPRGTERSGPYQEKATTHRMKRTLLLVLLTPLFGWLPVSAQSANADRQRAALALHASASAPAGPAAGELQQRAQRPFRHAEHRTVECRACHDMRTAHGRVTIRAPQDCESCHHREATSETCSRCHEASQYVARPYPQAVRVAVAGNERQRNLPFDHTVHATVACAECHRGSSPAAGAASCAGCHEQHHEVTRNCTTCHESPAADSHDVNAHVTCAGSGCHEASFLGGEPRTRQTCLACHRDQADHRPGESCADCHALPPFRRGGQAEWP
jgi:hypothetical protein